MNLLILVVDDEPDVEVLFRLQFRHDLRRGDYVGDRGECGSARLALETTFVT